MTSKISKRDSRDKVLIKQSKLQLSLPDGRMGELGYFSDRNGGWGDHSRKMGGKGGGGIREMEGHLNLEG